MIERSTCPRRQADECELLYLAELGTRELRADYLDRSERFDGKAHADALRARVAETWRDWKACHQTPLPCRCEAARAAAAAVHPRVNLPSDGSFLAIGHAGPLRRDGGVDSGVAA